VGLEIRRAKKMPSKLRYGLLLGITAIALIFTQVQHGHGAGYYVEYIYDDAGNLVQRIRHEYDATPPTTTPNPSGGTYYTPISVTLTCSDPGGAGCAAIYYSTNGSQYTTYSSPISIPTSMRLWFYSTDRANNTEDVRFQDYTIMIDTIDPTTTASPRGGTYSVHHTPVNVTLTCIDTGGSGCNAVFYSTNGSQYNTYSSPISISTNTTLWFYATDHAGNVEYPFKSETYTIDTCSALPAKVVGGLNYPTIQEAYNNAGSGATIKTRNVRFLGSLTTDSLNKTITLDGGYQCDFLNNSGTVTNMKGSITTTPNGGALTIKNFVLDTN
jgi:hypothetical protein